MRTQKNWFPDDKATHEWLDSLKKSTRATYQTNWKYFLEFTAMTGDQILIDRKDDKDHRWERKVLAFKQWLITEKGQAEYTATAASMTVRGFFAYFYVKLEYRREEAKRLKERKRVTEDYKFTREDLRKMAEVANLTEKHVLLSGKSFGLRAGDFLKLTRGQLEPYLNREPPISIGELPTQKESIKAYPFIDSDALPIVRLMIEQMNREGRTNPTDKILTYSHDLELSRILRRLATKAGILFGSKRVRFHCLRKFLTDHLSSVMSESKWKQIVGKSISEGAYISADELRKDYIKVTPETTITQLLGESDKLDAQIETLKTLAESLLKIPRDKIELKISQYDTKEAKLMALKELLGEHDQPIGGGLSFEQRAIETLAKIIMGALKKVEETKTS